MKETILKIIRENKESHMSLQEGEIASAKEIAETFERFLSWLNEFCIGYGNGWLYKPHTADEKLFETHKDLFTYAYLVSSFNACLTDNPFFRKTPDIITNFFIGLNIRCKFARSLYYPYPTHACTPPR